MFSQLDENITLSAKFGYMSAIGVLDRYQRRFSGQETRETKSMEVVRNPIVDEICKIYEEWIEGCKNRSTNQDYGTAQSILGNYTSRDVRDFSVRLKKYEGKEVFVWSGIFLSVLINNSVDSGFEIVTEHLDIPIYSIGHMNKKNVFVQGNSGDRLGYRMRSGSITVKGDTGDIVGFGMKGGEIFVDGKIGSFAEVFYKGKIYHKGKLVREE